MILQQLYADAEAILGESLPPPMYDTKPVRWIVPLTADGKLDGSDLIPLGGSKEDKNGRLRLIPYVGRTSGIRAILLVDKPSYALGVSFDDKPATEQHEAFKSLVLRCAEATNDPLVRAVSAFLASWNPKAQSLPVEMGAGDIIEFTVDGERPTDVLAVRRFWADNSRHPGIGAHDVSGQCLVTGFVGPLEKSLPGMIKRLPGGQTSGTALVSVNCDAFESYGLKGGLTSPVSRDAGERFTKALNHMIATPAMHINVGGLVYVFWTKHGADSELVSFIDRPDTTQVKNLIDCYRTGRQYPLHGRSPEEEFHAFAVSASGARVVIRDWITTTIKTTRDRLVDWFEAQRIMGTDGQEGDYFGIYRLAAGMYRDARKEMSSQVPRALMRAAVYGDALPTSLLDMSVMRNRTERRVTRNRAALIKAVFVSRKEMEATMTSLNAAETNKAYLCGRLLAQLERIQRNAQGNIKSTLTDRYYGAASTRPATVFGILLSDANKGHLPKIRKMSEKTYNALQNRLGDIVNPLDGEFPSTLTLEEQGRFALGYYFQRTHNLKEALAHNAKTGETDPLLDDIKNGEEKTDE